MGPSLGLPPPPPPTPPPCGGAGGNPACLDIGDARSKLIHGSNWGLGCFRVEGVGFFKGSGCRISRVLVSYFGCGVLGNLGLPLQNRNTHRAETINNPLTLNPAPSDKPNSRAWGLGFIRGKVTSSSFLGLLDITFVQQCRHPRNPSLSMNMKARTLKRKTL